MPHCFLSYARADADVYFNTFVNDFLEELRGRVGATIVEGLVFRDTSDIPLGAIWEPEIDEALRTCRTFLAMLSPTYLRRPRCNKEWAYFEWRLQKTGADGPPHRFLPLVWIPVPTSDQPPAVQARQSKHAALGTSYAVRGLRYLVQNGGTPYRDFLMALADLVRDLTHEPALPLPPALSSLDKLSDPFRLAPPAPVALPVIATTAPTAPTAMAALAPSAIAAAAIGGPSHVEFIVVAAHQDELAAVRRVVAAYGSDVTKWCPYRPADDTSAGLMVQGVAVAEKLTTNLLVPQNIVDILRGARAKNTIVVIVIDVWSLQLPAYSTMMSDIDGAERFPNAGVLVVWNLADGETPDHQQALVDALKVSFPTLMIMKDPLVFHDQLSTPTELTEKLRATLHVLKRRITDFGDVMRMAKGSAPIAKPLLVGPGETR